MCVCVCVCVCVVLQFLLAALFCSLRLSAHTFPLLDQITDEIKFVVFQVLTKTNWCQFSLATQKVPCPIVLEPGCLSVHCLSCLHHVHWQFK